MDNKLGEGAIYTYADGRTIRPVRKVTRTEIVPGIYGRVLVDGTIEPYVEGRAIRANVTLVDVGGRPSGDWRVFLDSSELRSAASIFTELADAFDAMAEERYAVREAGVL